jgi:hypothetical protein
MFIVQYNPQKCLAATFLETPNSRPPSVTREGIERNRQNILESQRGRRSEYESVDYRKT